MKKYRGICAGIFGCICIGLFMGCENKNVNYSIDSENGDTQTADDGKKSSLEQFADAKPWEKEVEAGVGKQGDKVVVSIDAEISVPDVEQMSVAEVKEAEFDAAYKEKIAGSIFGDEELYYNDIPHLSKKALEERSSFYEQVGNTHSAEQLEELLAECENAMETARDTDDYIPVDGYTVNEYIGTLRGSAYELSFTERTNERDADAFIHHRTKEIAFVPKDVHEICPKELSASEYLHCFPGTRSVSGNQCELTEEQAKEEAWNFIDKLGLEYPVFAYSRPLLWSGNFGNDVPTTWTGYYGDMVVNGYVFFYDFGIDDVSVVSYGIEKGYSNLYLKKKDSEPMRYSLEARIQIYVTDAGVIQMNAYNPLETISVSANVGLLPLDTIYEIMEQQLTDHLAKLRFAYTNFNEEIPLDKMELIYFRVRDEANPGYYSYVPTWRLGELAGTVETQREQEEEPFYPMVKNTVLINAIDGSPIDLFDEV